MYSLDCNYYTKTFKTLDELITDIMMSGMDPNYEITKDNVGMGEIASDYIVY